MTARATRHQNLRCLNHRRTAIHIARVAAGLIIVLGCAFAGEALRAQDQKPQETITVTGKLNRVMAIGGESTGWAIQLNHEITVEGKHVSSLEIDYPKTKRLEKLENKPVNASGKITHRHGVESGDRLILDVTWLKEIKPI